MYVGVDQPGHMSDCRVRSDLYSRKRLQGQQDHTADTKSPRSAGLPIIPAQSHHLLRLLKDAVAYIPNHDSTREHYLQGEFEKEHHFQ